MPGEGVTGVVEQRRVTIGGETECGSTDALVGTLELEDTVKPTSREAARSSARSASPPCF